MSRTRFGNNFFKISSSVNSRAFLRFLGMGLADEIEKEISHAMQRIPWILELLTGEQSVEDVRRVVPEHAEVELLQTALAILKAHRLAILRLAREIDDLRALLGVIDEDDD